MLSLATVLESRGAITSSSNKLIKDPDGGTDRGGQGSRGSLPRHLNHYTLCYKRAEEAQTAAMTREEKR